MVIHKHHATSLCGDLNTHVLIYQWVTNNCKVNMKPVSNLLYDSAFKYQQINHKRKISQHYIRFPLHFTKTLSTIQICRTQPTRQLYLKKKISVSCPEATASINETKSSLHVTSLGLTCKWVNIYTHMKLLLATAAPQ